ncbi:MAG: hypothetical protein E7559_02870 [Ruminococcaceae bacterium]|nr:hypothetical protein [Oscillospiraceae bacterium]
MMGLTEMLKTSSEGGNKRLKLIIAMGLTAMLLLLFSDMLPACGKQSTTAKAESTEQYAEQLEQRLEQLISGIEGAGRTEVMVTLKNGREYVYASEDRVSTDSSESVGGGGVQSSDRREDSENSFIIIDSSEGEEALIRTELMPTVNGVVVLCEGAEDPLVYERVKQAVTTALNISSKRVCIILISQ